MAIRTFSAQDSYKRGGTEPRKKLKKVRSVKVANLDKLRSSMKRDKNRFYRGVEASTDELTEPNSAAICGTSSPNYMKATTSSSARKGSLQSSSGSAAKNESSASSVKSASKINRVSVQDYSDPAGVNIPVKVKSEKILKRVPSLKTSKRLSSKKSMRIRARYSQFSDFGIDQGEMMEIDTESLIASSSNDQDFMTGMDVKQKGVLERSRSRKMTRLRSIRSSRARQMQKFRFSGDGKDIVPFEAEVLEPHYMKATTSQQARKNSDKGLARTSSLRPLRILAKIPSLRPRRSKVKKRPQDTPLSGTSVNRPTCSSTLKRNQFSEDIELHSGDRELDGTSSLHVCPYSYCSIHGHRHHTPQPLKEFISAKRKLFNDQKGEQPENQSRRGVKNVASAPETETDHSEHKFSTESYAAVHEMMSTREENALEDDDYGMDFLIKIYAKPRKKWATEGTLGQDAEALNIAIYNQINSEQYKEKLAKTLSGSSGVEEKKGELNDGQETHQQNSKISAISSPCEFHDISPKSVSVDETLEPSVAEKLPKSPENPLQRDSEASPHNHMTNILSDKRKYTSMWQLIYQELVSNEASISEALGDIQAEEQESDVGKFSHERCIKEDVDDNIAERKKLEIEQTTAIKLVQGALNTILQHDTKSYHQQSKIMQEVNNSFVTDGHLREGDQKDENGIDLDPAEKQQNMKEIGLLLKNDDRKEQRTVGEKVSKSLSKLRKMFMTAKFIKAMEGLKKINPHTPQYLSAQPILENEMMYLRHLSTQERKNTEEWMLDYALKQVISRLDPDEQRRVAQLVEAFERVAPQQEEMSHRLFPLASMPDPGRELAVPTNGEEKQFVESIQDLPFSCDQLVEIQDAGALVFLHDVPEGKKLTKEHTYLANKTDDEIMQESAEAEISGSTLVLTDKSYKSASFDKASYDEVTVIEKSNSTLEVPSENPIQNSEVSPTGDMTSIFINKQKYTSMWNLIYQHVSSEVSVNENQEIEGVDEEEQSFGTNSHKNVTSEKPDLDQSTAIKLVKEALSAILKDEPASHTEKSSTDVENSSFPLQQEVESGDKFEEPQRKMSKSLSKLKKAIATTRFIKAMERLMKNSPRKSQIFPSDTTLAEEKVHLRHRSMNGRKKDEEWMLDYALRQVVSKLDPDQQRRVASLVEAFETMHPEQKEMRIRCPLKGEATDCNELATCKSDMNENNLQSQQQQSSSIKKVHHKQDDGILLPIRGAFPNRSLQEHDPQASSADVILVEEIKKSRISDSTSESSEHETNILASVDVKLEEQRVADKETGRVIEYTSPLPTGNAEVKSEGEMASILFDKQKYTSMWHLIYQHVLSNEASTTGKQEVNDDEKLQDDNANNFNAFNDPGSTQSAQLGKSKVDDDKQSAASDQSAAIYLVKEAIHAILQSHEQKSDQQSLEDHGRGGCKSTAALASTTEDVGQKKIEEHRDTELEEKLHIVENTSVPLQQVAEPKEATRKMSKSLSKLKRAIVTTKFIKAMERLRKISPRKPRHLSVEESSEERVYLRHLSINARKNDEEWMLDYALRKVISDLAPDQQRKVAQLVGAFEKVNSGQKGTRNETGAEGELTLHCESKADKEQILEYKQESSTACESNTLPMHTDNLSMLQTHCMLEKNVLDDQNINLSNLKMELPHKILDSEDSNSNIHHQDNSKGNTVGKNILTRRDEIDEANPTYEPIKPAKDSEKNNNVGMTKGLFCDKQKNSSMWLLIYQHVKSVSDTESGSKPIERLINEDQQNKDDASAEMIDDDIVDSSVTTELTENDAIKLVIEAINDILDAPQAPKNELSSGNKTAEDHSKSLSRGYSKLKKLIICNKFIKAMEKTRKFDSEKQPNLELNSDSEMVKAQLKTSRVGEREGMDEWMLDNVLQKAIAGLAPIKQKRVALLVEAFEKVNPNPEESGKGPSCTETEFLDPIFLEGDTKESENTKTLQNSKLPCSFNLKLEGSTTSCSEATTARVQQEIHKDKSPVLTKETLPDGGNRKSDGLCTTTAAASVAINTLSHTNNQRTEIDGANESRVPLEEIITFRDRSGDQHQEKTPTFADKSLQPDDLEGKWNHGAQDSGPLRKSSSLWGLILQRVTVDMLEKGETPKATIDVDAQEVKDKVLEREIDESCQPASKVKSCRDMGVQTPASFHFEEDEAVKLVEEAVEEMLLVQDQLSDTESMTSSTISEQEVHSQNNGDKEESSPTATQITGVTESFQLANPDEEKLPKKENLLKSYSTLSKIMMCKRFIKAMDKRRKLKPASTQEVAQPSHVEEGIPSLRQITTSNKNGLEEGMLDHALQKVIGNLAPAKKQRVALLVQAFEAVGSQPEPRSSWRGKVSVS